MLRHLISLLAVPALLALYLGYGTGGMEKNHTDRISYQADSLPKAHGSTVSEGIVLVDTIEGVDEGCLFRIDTMRAEVQHDDGASVAFDSYHIFSFPLVRSSRDASIGRRITHDLWNRVSDSGRDLTVFAGTVPDQLSGTIWLSFDIVWQNQHLLVVRITGEGCGAYCESWESYFTYDTDSGRAVELTTLLTEEGERWIVWDSYRRARRAIVDYLAFLEDNQTGEDSLRVAEQIDLYEGCLRRAWYIDDTSQDAFQDGFEQRFIDVPEPEFWITNDSIFLPQSRCSAHVNRALDDLWDNVQAYAISDLVPYLTEAGRGYFEE